MKKRIIGISSVIALLLFLILAYIANHLGQSQLSQSLAERWDAEGKCSQISCFFSVNRHISTDELEEFRHSIDSALSDAGMTEEPEEGIRRWVDAYSADGTITLSTARATVSADAVGIRGDFFLFHPMQLLSGSYFSGSDLMQDYCVIDQDAAWQLFGSSDVAGMTVYVGGIPHVITGVVKREDSKLGKAAGLDGTLVYVSYQTLEQLGQNNGINCYEVVMPNPVTDFAYSYVKEKLGGSDKEVQIIENTSRYSLLSRLSILTQFGKRSMNGKAIIYPFWENIARGYEDITATLTLLEMVLLLYALIVLLILYILWCKNKGWTIGGKLRQAIDVLQRRLERQRVKRLKKQGKADLFYIQDLDEEN